MLRRIRVIALGIVRRSSDGALLVEEGRDTSDGRVFQRPLGGSVEFGEVSAGTVEREFMEETGLSLRTTGLVGVVESLFRYGGEDLHEIVFLHSGEFADLPSTKWTLCHGSTPWTPPSSGGPGGQQSRSWFPRGSTDISA